MVERTVRCRECGRRNRLPDGYLVEAHCGRCQSALTYYTWMAAGLRSRGLKRGVQVIGGTALLVALFGSDVVAWWESDPFRLTGAVETASAGDSLASDGLTED